MADTYEGTVSGRAGGRQWAVKASLALLGTLLSLGMAECALRIVEPSSDGGYLGLTRAFAEAMVIEDSALHHRLKPNAEATVGGIPYHTDALGHRVVEGSGSEPLPSPTTVAFGDSVTMGWGVAAKDAWPALVEPMAINAGVLGYGIQEVVANVERHLAHRAATPERKARFIVAYYPNDPEPAALNASAHKVSQWRVVRLWNRVFGGEGQSAIDRYRALHASTHPLFKGVGMAFQRLGKLQGDGVEILVVLIPALEAFVDGEYQLSEVHRRARSSAEAHGLRVLDLSEVVRTLQGDPVSYWVAPDDPHPDARVHRAYARKISASFR